jgi:hypothetical protein
MTRLPPSVPGGTRSIRVRSQNIRRRRQLMPCDPQRAGCSAVRDTQGADLLSTRLRRHFFESLYSRFATLIPAINKITHTARKRKNRNFAIPAAAVAMPVKPKSAATSAITRNITAQRNIIIPPPFPDSVLVAILRAFQLPLNRTASSAAPQLRHPNGSRGMPRCWLKVYAAAVPRLCSG